MSILKDKNGMALERKALAYALGLDTFEPETKEVQIIVRSGFVESVRNWPPGLPGVVCDYDRGDALDEARCTRIEDLIKDGETTPDHVLVNIGAFDWLIAKAMNRHKGEK